MALDPANFSDLLYANYEDFSAFASSAAEGSLLTKASRDEQPTFPPNFFMKHRRCVDVLAMGVFSNTATPTLTFQARVGSTQGSASLTGVSVGVSAAITTQSGITNKWWKLYLRLVVNGPGQGANKATLSGAGFVASRGGFNSSGYDEYPLEPTAPDTATWTATLDASVQLYLNLSATWSASSASNTITLKHLTVSALN